MLLVEAEGWKRQIPKTTTTKNKVPFFSLFQPTAAVFLRDAAVCGARSKGIPNEGASDCERAFRGSGRKRRCRRRIKRKWALITPPPPATIIRPCVALPTFHVFFPSFFTKQQNFTPNHPGFVSLSLTHLLFLTFLSFTRFDFVLGELHKFTEVIEGNGTVHWLIEGANVLLTAAPAAFRPSARKRVWEGNKLILKQSRSLSKPSKRQSVVLHAGLAALQFEVALVSRHQSASISALADDITRFSRKGGRGNKR